MSCFILFYRFGFMCNNKPVYGAITLKKRVKLLRHLFCFIARETRAAIK